MIKVLIFTHGELGSELLRTAESVIGEQKDAFVFSLSLKDSLLSISNELKALLEKLKSDEGILIMTDMAGGTPCNASLAMSKDYKLEVITGINLYMLISACMNRNNMELKQLAVKVMEDAKKNITNAREALVNKLK